MDLVGHGFDEADQEGRRCHPVGAFHQLHEGEFACAINAHEQVELALGCLNLSNVPYAVCSANRCRARDVEEAERVGFELGLDRFVAPNLWQPADAMTLKATMQRQTRQEREGGLKRIEAVVEQQQGVPAKGHDHSHVYG